MRITLEIQYKGKVYKQPDCRFKLSPDGEIMFLIHEEGKWNTVRSKDVSVIKWEDTIFNKQKEKESISKKVEIGMSTAEIFKAAIEDITYQKISGQYITDAPQYKKSNMTAENLFLPC